MEHHLPENIRALRKLGHFTQEQLAEAMGVTVGAVSKWELGQSAPDLSTLMELADFFDTSVDALLGYTLRENSAELAAGRIKTLQHDRRFDECLVEAEKALQKYPNRFAVVLQCACSYDLVGVERNDAALSRRALALFQHARTLLDQNTDEDVSEISICNAIADIHLFLDEPELALDEWRRHNYDGLNDAAIGRALATQCNRPAQALPVLSSALMHAVNNLVRTVIGFVNAYSKTNQMRQALDIARWLCDLLDGLQPDGGVTFLTKAEAALLGFCASAALQLDGEDAAREYLRRAKRTAEAFDRAPTDQVQSLRFYCGRPRQAADDLGSSAMDALEREGLSGMDDAAHNAKLIALWAQVKEEAE